MGAGASSHPILLLDEKEIYSRSNTLWRPRALPRPVNDDQQRLIQAFTRLACELDVEKAKSLVIEETRRLMSVEIVALFMVDDTGELNLEVASHELTDDAKEFATKVLAEGKAVVLEANLGQGELKVGEIATSVLGIPVVSTAGKNMAILVVGNKLPAGTQFTDSDGVVGSGLGSVGAVRIRNARLYQQARKQEERALALLDLVKALSTDFGVSSLLFTVTRRTKELLNADRCKVLVVDQHRSCLWSISSDNGQVGASSQPEIEAMRMSLSKGIAGECATSGKLISTPDAYSDPRFYAMNDERTGFKTKSMVCCPIFGFPPERTGAAKEVVAVLEVVNKLSDSGVFTSEDEEVLTQISELVGEKAQLYLDKGSPLLEAFQGMHAMLSDTSKEAEAMQDKLQEKQLSLTRRLKTMSSQSCVSVQEEDEEVVDEHEASPATPGSR